jgi:hypothetical protein
VRTPRDELDGLGPGILAVAIDLGDGGIAPAGGQHAAVGPAARRKNEKGSGLE